MDNRKQILVIIFSPWNAYFSRYFRGGKTPLSSTEQRIIPIYQSLIPVLYSTIEKHETDKFYRMTFTYNYLRWVKKRICRIVAKSIKLACKPISVLYKKQRSFILFSCYHENHTRPTRNV